MWMCPEILKPTVDKYRVYDILMMYHEKGITPNLAIVVNETTLADYNTVLGLWVKRQDWIYCQSKLQHVVIPETGEELHGGFIFSDWLNFIARNGENLKRMIDALYADYNPIENYNMREQSADGTKQDSHTTTPHGKITVETTPYATGINSTGDGAQMGKTTTTTSYTDADSEITYDNTMSIKDNDDNSESGYHKGEQHYLKRSGNIGVTTSAQMITQELELRVVDLIADFVKRFFDQYCYYVG